MKSIQANITRHNHKANITKHNHMVKRNKDLISTLNNLIIDF